MNSRADIDAREWYRRARFIRSDGTSFFEHADVGLRLWRRFEKVPCYWPNGKPQLDVDGSPREELTGNIENYSRQVDRDFEGPPAAPFWIDGVLYDIAYHFESVRR